MIFAWLLRRPPTPGACMRRACAAQPRGSGLGSAPMRTRPSVPDTAPGATVELDPAPHPRYRDPYVGIVTGPLLVERTRWVRAWHQTRYGDDLGFPEIDWGTFTLQEGP